MIKSFRIEGKCLFKCISLAYVSVTSLIFLWPLAISIRKWQNSLHAFQGPLNLVTWFTRGPLNLGIIGIDLVGSRPSAFWIRCAVVPLSACWWFTADCLLRGWSIAKKHLTMFNKHWSFTADCLPFGLSVDVFILLRCSIIIEIQLIRFC